MTRSNIGPSTHESHHKLNKEQGANVTSLGKASETAEMGEIAHCFQRCAL
jgi:hypothetical protein